MAHIIFKLYSPVCDFPLRHGEPCTEYMLASLPRSGSTFFATELWRTGVLGAPMEYLNPYYVNFLSQRNDFDGHGRSEYWAWVKRHRTSPNGVFGYKMFAYNYIRMSSRSPDWLQDIAPRKVVLLLRTNILEQAVSYSKAMRSKIWFAGTNIAESVEYDADHIEACLELIIGQFEFWTDLLDLTQTKVCAVSYEETLVDLAGAVERVASFLGVTLRHCSTSAPPVLRVQRNQQSFEWMNKFMNERGRCGREAVERATAAAQALLTRH